MFSFHIYAYLTLAAVASVTWIETRFIVWLQPHDAVTNICQTADKQLFALVEWAKRIPHFSELPLDDQVILLRAGTTERLLKWNAASVDICRLVAASKKSVKNNSLVAYKRIQRLLRRTHHSIYILV